jgi:LacI family purine nucleotide synthesis repressor
VPFRDEWFFRTGTYEHGGAEMAKRFLAMKERPTALTIVNDYVALAFMVEVMRAGVRIPEELSVVGHDNQPIAAYCPVPLTSMTQPTQKIAQTVVELLMQRLEEDTEDAFDGGAFAPREQIITGDLVLRNSTTGAG